MAKGEIIKRVLLVYVASCLLLSQYALSVQAQGNENPLTGEDMDKRSSKDTDNAKDQSGKVIVAKGGDTMLHSLSGIKTYRGMFMGLLYGKRSKFLGVVPVQIRDLDSRHPVIREFLAPTIFNLLIPLYALLIILTGIYYVWASISPNIRAMVKTQLTYLIVGMIACGLSLQIFDILLELNNFLLDEILSVQFAGNRIVPTNWDPITGFLKTGLPGVAVGGSIIALILVATGGVGVALIWPIVLMLVAAIILPYIILAIRFDVVLVFGGIFPFTVFCMSFDYLRGMGNKLMKLTLTWIFLPIPMAIFMVLSQAFLDTASSLGMALTSAMAALVAFAMIGFSPMMIASMTGIAGAAFIYAGQTMGNPRLVFIGSMIQGQGAAAITSAAMHAERLSSRTQASEASAAGYNIPSRGDGPLGAGAAQPPPPYSEGARKASAEHLAASGSKPTYAQSGLGDGVRETGAAGGGVFDKGISLQERRNRLLFGDPVEAGTPPEYMSSQQYYGMRYAQSSGLGKVGWQAAGLAANAKFLLPPAGYFLRGMLRGSIADYPIGKSLANVSWKMTGRWEKDPATGKTMFNHGWLSVKGISGDLANTAADMYKGYKPGEGTPPAVKAAILGSKLGFPIALLMLPMAPVVGLGIMATAAVAMGTGTRMFKRMGERVAGDGEAHNNIRAKAQERKPIQEKLMEAEAKNGGQMSKDQVRASLTDRELKSFGYKEDDPSTRAGAVDRAYGFYQRAAAVTEDKAWGGTPQWRQAQLGYDGKGGANDKLAKAEALDANRNAVLLDRQDVWEATPENMRKRMGWKKDYEGAQDAKSRSRVEQAMNKAYGRYAGVSQSQAVQTTITDVGLMGLYTTSPQDLSLDGVSKARDELSDAAEGRQKSESRAQAAFESKDLNSPGWKALPQAEAAAIMGKTWTGLSAAEQKLFGHDVAEWERTSGAAAANLRSARDRRDSAYSDVGDGEAVAWQVYSGLGQNEREQYLNAAKDALSGGAVKSRMSSQNVRYHAAYLAYSDAAKKNWAGVTNQGEYLARANNDVNRAQRYALIESLAKQKPGRGGG